MLCRSCGRPCFAPRYAVFRVPSRSSRTSRERRCWRLSRSDRRASWFARGSRSTRRDAKNSKTMEMGIVPTDEGAVNHHSCGGGSSVHNGPARLRAKDRDAALRRSRRDGTKRRRSPGKSTTYTVLIPKRRDATDVHYIRVMTIAPQVPDTIGSPGMIEVRGYTSTLCHCRGLMVATKSTSTGIRFR